MGRKTFVSIGKPLPGRRTIVLTRNPGSLPSDVEKAASLSDALAMVAGGSVGFVAGGSEVFREALPHAHVMHLTLVHAVVRGDTWFPPFDVASWELVDSVYRAPDAKNRFPLSFRRYERRDS